MQASFKKRFHIIFSILIVFLSSVGGQTLDPPDPTPAPFVCLPLKLESAGLPSPKSTSGST